MVLGLQLLRRRRGIASGRQATPETASRHHHRLSASAAPRALAETRPRSQRPSPRPNTTSHRCNKRLLRFYSCHFFLRFYARKQLYCFSASYPSQFCPSVCLSVCPYVTRQKRCKLKSPNLHFRAMVDSSFRNHKAFP